MIIIIIITQVVYQYIHIECSTVIMECIIVIVILSQRQAFNTIPANKFPKMYWIHITFVC